MPSWHRYRLLLEHADNSTFAKARAYQALQSFLSQDEDVVKHRLEAAVGGVTLDLVNWTTINGILVENLDTTNYVEVEWYYQRGTQADTVTFAQAATGDTITDDSAAGTLVTNGSRAGAYVRITNAATAANNGTWLIRSATTNIITLVTESTMVADGGDVVNLFFEERNTQRLPAARVTGEQSLLYVGGPIVPEQDLVLTSAAGTPACLVTVFGT